MGRGFSFPSGHTTTDTAILVTVTWFALRRASWTTRAWVWGGVVGLLVLIGADRLVLAAHYPSDVLGGYALGALWAAACVVTFRTWWKARS